MNVCFISLTEFNGVWSIIEIKEHQTDASAWCQARWFSLRCHPFVTHFPGSTKENTRIPVVTLCMWVPIVLFASLVPSMHSANRSAKYNLAGLFPCGRAGESRLISPTSSCQIAIYQCGIFFARDAE